MIRCLFILVLFFSFFVKSKSQTIDSGNIKCTYNLTYLPDSSKPNKKRKDILILLIGTHSSSFYSYINFQSDSAFKADIDGGLITSENLLNNKNLQKKYSKPGFYSNYNLFINYPEKKITTTDMIGTKKYIYEEDIETIKWSICPDTMSLLSYHCQKANAVFRGRKYEAWFTSEIPINAGPYKFQGLPGLIIKIADVKNNYTYECVGVERMKTYQSIIIDKKNYIKTTRLAFRKGFQFMFQNPWESLSAGSNVTLSGRDVNKMKAMLQKGIPYNPIELE